MTSAATLDCLSRLIGFDTTSRNSNLDCIDWARAHLAAHGAVCRLDWNADRSKANLLASFGEGPGGLVLSGHVDVVPVDGQAWTSDPFTATIRDGRVHGRGACDMKGFDAVILGLAPRHAAAPRPVHIALTYDEELGCLGIPHLIAAMQGWGIHPEGCVVGEPTSMRLVSAHKGGRVYRCRVTGRAAHSSLTPAAVNAIEYAALMIARIRALAAAEREHGPRAAGFDVPYTTMSVNLAHGGSGANIVPAAAEFTFDLRHIPATDADRLIGEVEALAATLSAEMRAVAPEAGIALDCLGAIPPLAPDEHSAIHRTALALLPDRAVEQVSYGTEAGFFQRYGVPTIVCGPGSITEAHKPDEYVSLDQLAACERFITALVAG